MAIISLTANASSSGSLRLLWLMHQYHVFAFHPLNHRRPLTLHGLVSIFRHLILDLLFFSLDALGYQLWFQCFKARVQGLRFLSVNFLDP